MVTFCQEGKRDKEQERMKKEAAVDEEARRPIFFLFTTHVVSLNGQPHGGGGGYIDITLCRDTQLCCAQPIMLGLTTTHLGIMVKQIEASTEGLS